MSDQSLDALVKEQTALQCIVEENLKGKPLIHDRTTRDRTILEYGTGLFPPDCSNKLHWLLDDMAMNKDKVVWIDLGCGHAIALREGKRYFYPIDG